MLRLRKSELVALVRVVTRVAPGTLVWRFQSLLLTWISTLEWMLTQQDQVQLLTKQLRPPIEIREKRVLARQLTKLVLIGR